MQLLLERQAVTILADNKGRTPLHMIADVLRVEVYAEGTDATRIAEARSTAVSIAEKLLMCKANPNVPDARERTPLHAAALGGAVELMALLVKHKAKPEDADSRLERALHCAARYFASDVAAVSTHDESSGEPSVVAAARVTSQIGCRAVAFLLHDSMEPERYVNARNV